MYGDRSPTFYNESCGKMIGHFAVLELLWSPLQWALKWYFLTFTLNMPGHQMGRHCQSKGQTSTGDRHGFTISKAAVNWHEPLQPTTRRYCTLQHTDVQLSYVAAIHRYLLKSTLGQQFSSPCVISLIETLTWQVTSRSRLLTKNLENIITCDLSVTTVRYSTTRYWTESSVAASHNGLTYVITYLY